MGPSKRSGDRACARKPRSAGDDDQRAEGNDRM